MKWYVARFLYQIIPEGHSQTNQFDEQVRLVRADDPAWAWEKAHVLGRLGECRIINEKSVPLQWKFVSITNMYPLHELADGGELFSDTWHMADGEEFVQKIQTQSVMAKDWLLSRQ